MTVQILKSAAIAVFAGLLSSFAGQGQAQPGQAWKITTRKTDALAETRIGSLHVRLSGRCTKSGSPYVVVGLEGYRGNALRKIEEVEQSVTFVAAGQDGNRIEHRGAMFKFGDEVTMRDTLPAAFFERLAQSERLLIRNASGQSILTVSLADARQFPERLARLCGTARPQNAEAQSTPGQKASPQKGQVVRSLPLKRGFYVASDTPCSQASNATLQLVRRDGIGVARETCTFKQIEQTAPAGYRVVEERRSMEGGPAETHISLFDVRDDGRFSVARSNGQPYSARYCVQSSLPSPWRDNNIRDLIR